MDICKSLCCQSQYQESWLSPSYFDTSRCLRHLVIPLHQYVASIMNPHLMFYFFLAKCNTETMRTWKILAHFSPKSQTKYHLTWRKLDSSQSCLSKDFNFCINLTSGKRVISGIHQLSRFPNCADAISGVTFAAIAHAKHCTRDPRPCITLLGENS